MKIQGNDGLPPLFSNERTPPAAAPGGAFGAMLKETLGEAPAASASGLTTAVQFRPAIKPLATGEGAPEFRIERFIDLLDDYRGQLADSRVTLRQLDPAVRSIEEGREALAPMLAQLPDGDGLKDILSRALVTAESEIARYRRGDYLPA